MNTIRKHKEYILMQVYYSLFHIEIWKVAHARTIFDAQHARTIFDAQHARAIFDAQHARAIFYAQ